MQVTPLDERTRSQRTSSPASSVGVGGWARIVRPSPVGPSTAPFRCEVRQHPAAAEVIPQGELDVATAPSVEHRLHALRAAGSRIIVLDLREVSFLDVAGLRLILRWTELARHDWSCFAVIPGPRAVQRLFALTATERRVQFVDASASRRWSAMAPQRRLRGLNRLGRL
jgi:anti-anti-sigma factor